MKIIAFYLFCLFTISSYGQLFSPQIDNYNFADNQNWGIDISEDDLIFVANNKGLVRYTGQQWELLELPKKTIVRSVFNDGEIVYTGSYEEFGYWKKNIENVYEYTSLTHLFGQNTSIDSEEFWQILKFEDAIVFRSFGGVYVYDGTTIETVENSQGVIAMTTYNGKLLLATSSTGLQQLVGSELQSFELNATRPLMIINNLSAFENQLFIYDDNQGGFLYDGETLTRLPQSLNTLLSANVLNKVAFLDKNTLSFGTIKNGLIIYNLNDDSTTILNKASGINNNTVLGLDYHKGNLWAALDNGTCKINLKSSYRYYFDLSGDLGTVYDVAFFNDQYYLASNTGIYTFENNKLKLIQGSEGHVWNLTVANNKLFCGHNDGTYVVNGDKVEALNLSYGGVYNFTPIPGKPMEYLQATYSGITYLRNVDGSTQITKVEGLDTPINGITFNTDNKIWATHPYKGLFRFKLDSTFSRILSTENFDSVSILDQYKTEIIKIGEKTYFSNANHWYSASQWNNEIGFEEIKKLENFKSVGVEQAGGWFLDEKVTQSLVFYDNLLKEQLRISDFELFKHLVANYGNVVVKNDSIRMLNLNDGFATFNKNTIVDELLAPPIIDKMYSANRNFMVMDYSPVEISFKDASFLTIETYTPNTFQNEMSYQLSGATELNQVIKNGKFTLQNLNYGEHTLSIYNTYATDSTGPSNGTAKQISFTVLPPWYLSKTALIAYFLLLIGMIYFIYRRNKLKIQKEQIQLKQQYAKETQERIYALERANLEKQIKDKKKELTNSTASIIKKNEAIILLRNELTRLKDVSPNSYRTKKIIANSEKYINNKNDWKQFEESFKEFNADFFDNLRKSYPKLTSRDLKLCAYIKTGLTSKEIAPLMNISKRGIELHRYRLRKKLNMQGSDKFIKFLESC